MDYPFPSSSRFVPSSSSSPSSSTSSFTSCSYARSLSTRLILPPPSASHRATVTTDAAKNTVDSLPSFLPLPAESGHHREPNSGLLSPLPSSQPAALLPESSSPASPLILPIRDSTAGGHATIDLDGTAPKLASATLPSSSILAKFTPKHLRHVMESTEGSLIIPDISPTMLNAWESLHPSLPEADDVRYEYNSTTRNMIIKCMPTSIHDSLQVYFTRRITAELARAGDAYLDSVMVASGTDFQGFKGDYAYSSTKLPDAYAMPATGTQFPSVVAEAGWTEDMNQLISDAKLWLLGTSFQTKVVILVAFSEDHPASSPDSDEDALESSVDSSTEVELLANSILELHRRNALARPLLGSIAATIHVYRLDEIHALTQTFSASVLPPAAAEEPSFSLTMQDIFGADPVPPPLDPDREIVFEMDKFRTVILQQVPRMERHRSITRAVAMLERNGFAEEKETFAALKRKRPDAGVDGGRKLPRAG